MPFLRVIRDKRGYETTYLMDWHREGDRQRSHILYVFRTPGGVQVGRTALDAELRREIEAQYPQIVFDWNAVLRSQQVVDAAPDPQRLRRRRRAETAEPDGGESVAPAEAETPPGPGPLPSTIEGVTPDERVAFLVVWYPRFHGRIVQRHDDPARRAALLTLAERLNPATWSDADQITTGLEQAAEALERLSLVLGRRRRRSRRQKGAAAPADGVPAEAAPEGAPPEAPADGSQPEEPAPVPPEPLPSES